MVQKSSDLSVVGSSRLLRESHRRPSQLHPYDLNYGELTLALGVKRATWRGGEDSC